MYNLLHGTQLSLSMHVRGLPWWLNGKERTYYIGDTGDSSSIPELGRSLGGEHGNPLQFSCPENPMDRGPWRALVHRVA